MKLIRYESLRTIFIDFQSIGIQLTILFTNMVNFTGLKTSHLLIHDQVLYIDIFDYLGNYISNLYKLFFHQMKITLKYTLSNFPMDNQIIYIIKSIKIRLIFIV